MKITSNNIERRAGVMDCKKAENLMQGYLDGDLDEKQKIEFEEHLIKCQPCKVEYNEIKRVLEMLNSLPEMELPDNYRRELRSKLERIKGKNPLNKNFLSKKINFIKNGKIKAMTALAAGVLVVLVLRVAFVNGPYFKTKNTELSFSADSIKGDLGDLYDSQAEEDLKDVDGSSSNENVPKMAIRSAIAIPEEARGNGTVLFTGKSRINVTIVVKDNVIDENKIKEAAEQSEIQNFTDDFRIYQRDIKAEAELSEDEKTVIEFILPGEKYDDFLNVLKKEVELNNGNIYYANPTIKEDIRLELDELESKLNEINTKIQGIDNNKGPNKAPDPLKDADFESDKKEIQKEIDDILEKNEYIANVTIFISK
jgi:hypothetical protein